MSKMSLTKSQDGSRIPERGKTEVMSLVFDKKTSTLETPKNKMSGRPSQGTACKVSLLSIPLIAYQISRRYQRSKRHENKV